MSTPLPSTISNPTTRPKKERQQPNQQQLTQKRVVDSSQFCSEICTFLLPQIADSLTPHLIQSIKAEIIPIIVDHVTSTIGPDLNTMVSDYTTMLINKADETKQSIYQLSNQLSKQLSKPSSIVPQQSPNSILSNSDYRSHRNTPTSRDRYHRSTNRSRSRSPHRFTRGRSRSRSPVHLSHHQRKPPQCALCKGYNHLSKTCLEVKSLTTRLSIMRGENRCLQCFRPLDSTHYPTCEPPLCYRGCTDQHGRLERHAESFCPKNPNLTP